MLQFTNVKKQYGEREILAIPELSLESGVYWLQGINGSGKTTFLRIIAGLIPFQGDILIDRLNLKHKPLDYRRKISWSDAEPSYPHFLTGQEIVELYINVRKASLPITNQLINRLGFNQFLTTPIASYSSGMIKRLSLILAFIGNTSLVLLDEPLATLDAEAAMILPQIMMEYRQAYGTSFIFSSHQPFNMNSLTTCKKLIIADRIIHLSV